MVAKTQAYRSPMLNSRNILVGPIFCFVALLTPALAGAQDTGGAQTPVAYSSVNELNGILAQLQQTSQSIQADLGKTRIEKWKTDASTKQQTLANVQSIQRNLQSALPEII